MSASWRQGEREGGGDREEERGEEKGGGERGREGLSHIIFMHADTAHILSRVYEWWLISSQYGS